MSLTKSEITAVILTVAFICAAAAFLFFGSFTQNELSVSLEPIQSESAQQNESVPSDEKININTANEAALRSLPGIGEALARRVIAYREENGGFAATDEICKVSGIGEETFKLIKALITV